MKYQLHKPWESLDEWQKQVIEAKGNVIVRSGRQCGKSTAISIKAAEYAMNNPKKEVLIIASVERQAHLLFEKVISYIMEKNRKIIKSGKDRPTKSRLRLRNGSTIRSLPTGLSGAGIRGFTIDLLIADEAAFIGLDVWNAVSPMIAITKGKIILLSTPFGREGYFYERWNDPNFESFHVSSLDCPRRDDDFLKQEESRMTKLAFSQEYRGEFIDELRQFFSDKLIKKCLKLQRSRTRNPERDYFLGVDIARMGADESTFEILDCTDKKNIKQVENIITRKTLITDTIRRILELENMYDFKKIYIDDGGLGVGVYDHLLEEDATKRKVMAINNASRALDKDKKRRKKLLKEDLYMNLLRLMERNEISLLNDDEIAASLRSVQYEYADSGIKIFGRYTHIVEGLIRSAWCVRDKSLNIYIY
jgi:hypothetical protein